MMFPLLLDWHSVCTSVVSGLDNFMVGMPDTFPLNGSAVNTSSYTVCAMVKIEPTAGKVVTVNCPSTQQFRYVIIQSLDTSPERLCIAEVAVYCTSQYTVCYVRKGTADRPSSLLSALLIWVVLTLACVLSYMFLFFRGIIKINNSYIFLFYTFWNVTVSIVHQIPPMDCMVIYCNFVEINLTWFQLHLHGLPGFLWAIALMLCLW